ncbi:TIGR02391 family protein [Demequina sp.]|uniref:TIGR02391 family protein n=1 Tax=Demequina sp. TaxID=2050685 RepID=UPI0025BB454C|nr:TIGR02391 family protein [Demequina sp.]
MSEYGADYLRRLRVAVERFEAAFNAWMRTQDESDHMSSRGLLPTVWMKAGQDSSEVEQLELTLAEASGMAATAVAATGAYIAVAGVGAIDPISNWSLMSSPKALIAPRDVRMTAANVKGRLDAMIADAESRSESRLPAFSPGQFHAVVWAGASAHWVNHQYRVAVREAAEGLTIHWKERLGRSDVDDTVFWQQTLSPGEPDLDRPKLVWPGSAEDKTTRSMRGGIEPLAKALNLLATGLNLTVRNVATHTRTELPEQEAMERLAAYSYLARLLDQCTIEIASNP